MLEFLRPYGYTGALDGEIGAGGNAAWGLYEEELERKVFNQNAIETSNGVYDE